MDTNFLEKIEQFKLPLALSLFGMVLIIGGIFASNLSKPQTKEFPKESIVQQNQKQISVDVSGAVNKPGVYQLKDGDRIEEAVTAAGGFSENANQEYISKYLNMAQKLSDGTKIYVPVTGDSSPPVTAGSVAGASTKAAININTGTQAELESLPGIGPVTASKIISDRPYQDVADLLNKKVVSKSVYEKIKDTIIVY